MGAADVCNLFETLADYVAEIDSDCNSVHNGVELGLVNVKPEYEDLAYEVTGRKLSEEQLIAWLLIDKLRRAGHTVEWEVPYPALSRKRCDLVIRLNDRCRLWIELKLAWKSWFNCEGPPVYSNRSYRSYLEGGPSRTHSFRHDFDKLGDLNCPGADYRAVCLVGFDCADRPMGGEINAVVQTIRDQGKAWENLIERSWRDRRCNDFRINVHCWVLQRAD
jgi:hypothetical protein